MKTILRWTGTALGTAAIGATTLLITLTGPAGAEPSGCESAEKGSTSSDGHLVSAATGRCLDARTLNLAATVREDISGAPDRQVGRADTGNHAQKTYAITESTCDGGRTAVYFGVAFFTTNTTEHGSPHTKQHSCPK